MRKQKENELKSTKLVASILNVDMKSIKAAVKTPMVHFEHNLIDLNQPIEGAAAVGVAAVGAAAAEADINTPLTPKQAWIPGQFQTWTPETYNQHKLN
jgi:hypothetical protein